MVYPYNGKYYSAIKWMSLENIMPGERNQTQKIIYDISFIYELSRTGKFIEIEHRLVITGD